MRHVKPLDPARIDGRAAELGNRLASELVREKAIMGVFDEGCMGMFNAIIPDELLHRTGVFKERLSQSALYYETNQVDDDEATAVFAFEDVDGIVFAPDSAYAYVVCETGGTFELGRIDTSGDEAGMVETVVLESDGIVPGAPLDVRPDLGAVLFAGVVDDEPCLLFVEVDGALPAEPIVVNPPLVGLGFEGGAFSPDGTYAIYGEYDALGNS